MISKLFKDKAKWVKVGNGRWVQILPDEGDGYRLYDGLEGKELGRILVDQENYWIYDGRILNVDEQEEVAAHVTGSRKEMDDFFNRLLQ